MSCGRQDFVIKRHWTVINTGSEILNGEGKIKEFPSVIWSWIISKDKQIAKVKNITTIMDLAYFNSWVLNDSKKDHPRFIRLQKKQMLLAIAMSQVQTPEYQELQKKISAITEAKKLWTPEIQIVDKKIQDLRNSSHPESRFDTNEEFKKLMEQKNILMWEFRTKTEYKEYIKNNQSELDKLIIAMKKSWTPELIKLQQEVMRLRKEVYNM